MHKILRFAKTAYVKSQNLKPLLSSYTNPDDFISRMVKTGELIRLKNGFFLIAEKIEETPIPYEQIANLLFGPSYISKVSIIDMKNQKSANRQKFAKYYNKQPC